MQVPIVSGIYADSLGPDFRTSYPRNYVPVPKAQGISNGYLRPADGIVQTGTGQGVDRGGFAWNGVLYRVSGSKLIQQSEDGSVTVLGDVGSDGTPVTIDNGPDRIAIASAGSLYYWNGVTLTRVTDSDLGTANDVKYIGGYYMTTDGTYLVVTDLNDPTSVNPLHYGSAESDPDKIQAVDELRNEAYAFGRYTVEVFRNIGGTGFPFQRIDGAQVTKGCIGRNAYASLGDTFLMLGSGKGEAPAVYVMVPGNVQKVSTREIDQILLGYTEQQLSEVVMETKVDKNHQHVFLHLPDQCLVYDTIGSQALGEPIWFSLDSGVASKAAYRARGLVWCYDRWNVGDPTSPALGKMSSDVSSHFGQVVGWNFGTMILYNDGNGAIVHELELVCLTGRVASGANPIVWTQYSIDGETWSQERSVSLGKQGERVKRICWRTQGKMQHWRVQRFRGTSDGHPTVARLEMQIEPLFTKAIGNG